MLTRAYGPLLAAAVLSACAGQHDFVEPNTGMRLTNSFVGSPMGVDGVNATLIIRREPAFDRFGDSIVEFDPATGAYREVIVKTETDVVTDEPLAGELLLAVAEHGLGVLGAVAVGNLVDGCDNDCGGTGVILLNETIVGVNNTTNVDTRVGKVSAPRKVSGH